MKGARRIGVQVLKCMMEDTRVGFLESDDLRIIYRRKIGTQILPDENLLHRAVRVAYRCQLNPGFPEGVQGPELVNLVRKQAEKFGAKFKTDMISQIKKTDEGFELQGEKETIQAKTIIIATGASARWLGCKGEEEYKGKGVTVCATCDGFLYREKEVIVVGGGDSAMEEALFLTKFATKVTIVHRRDEFKASQIMQDRVKAHDKIEIKWNSEINEVIGDGQKVTGVKLKDTKTGELSDFKVDGVFLAIGHIPNTKFLQGFLDLDEKGYLKTDRYTNTNVKGIFGAGDVQDFSLYSDRNVNTLTLYLSWPVTRHWEIDLFANLDNDRDAKEDQSSSHTTLFTFELRYVF